MESATDRSHRPNRSFIGVEGPEGAKITLNRSMDNKKVNFSITQAQFNAMQDQVRSKLGMTMPMFSSGSVSTSNHIAAPYSQDRLIASISIIKEVLISNMQLREDLLAVSQEHENTMQTNF